MNPGMKSISADAMVDGRHRYAVIAQMPINQKKFGPEYLPTVQIFMPETPTVRLDGRFFYREGKKIIVNMKLENALRDPISLEGTFPPQYAFYSNLLIHLEYPPSVEVFNYRLSAPICELSIHVNNCHCQLLL